MRGQVKIYQKKLTARRRRRAFYLTLYSVAAAGLLLSLLSYVSQLPSFSIEGVSVRGNDRVSSSEVESVVWKDLVGNYGGFFSKSNEFLYPNALIRNDIGAIPAVKSVSVSRSGRIINVTVSERTKTAEWCSGAFGSTADCYSLDSAGYVFAKEACATSSVCVKASVSTTTSSGLIYRGILADDPVGQSLISADEFKKINFFIGELSGLSVDPREVELSGTSSAPYLTIVLGGGGRLVVNAGDDLSSVLSNIAAVISDRTVVPSLSEFLSKLDYMKLDIGNKVVYKLRSSKEQSSKEQIK
ncbi:MAG TPA: hypothetical protein VFT82_03695 [Candidatus Paceibacterota bacterium]|nr:hypothetical protein [Candidatus Paceibacterota bacterium]